MANFINGIAVSRKRAHLTQQQFADAVNVSLRTVSRWEKIPPEKMADAKIPLGAIAQALGVTTDELISPSDDTKKAPADPKVSEDRKERKIIPLDDWLPAPIVSREWTAHCGGGIPALDITCENNGMVLFNRGLIHTYDDIRPPFAIKCEGDCLESAGIKDGYFAIINPAEEVLPGAVALVSIGGNLSLKRVNFMRNGDVILRNDNDRTRMTPEEMEADDFSVIGALVIPIPGERPKPLPL